LNGFFDAVTISGEINRRKPSPEIFRKALKILDVQASKSVFVGDMLELDVIGPKNVGMKSILVKRRPIAKSANVEPDRQISSLTELLTVLEDF
jgi:putative hydrolase of the HAD superfamily